MKPADMLLVSGTRPEVIKLAPVYHALRECGWARPTWLHTGQHGDMAHQMLDCFRIQPDLCLDRGGESLLEFSTQCRVQLDRVMQEREWSAVIVQGDTESAFLGALTAFYHQIPVAHVEAGLRTRNLRRPFPEEGLRQMIGRIARWHLAPTLRAAQALREEGVREDCIIITGNTVVDAQQWVCRHHGIRRQTHGGGHLLVTMHRRENWGEDLDHACGAIGDIAREFSDLQVLFPVHLNPVVSEPVHRHLAGLRNVQLVAPLDYLAMQQALADAWLVLSDSGGLQEEAPTFRVPLLVMREETERPEIIDEGCGALVGTDRAAIVHAVRRLMMDELAYHRMQAAGNPFGDGTAATQIVRSMAASLGISVANDVEPEPEVRHGVA